jgi:hypothetical protein
LKWVQDYKDAFTELVRLDQATLNDDDIKERCLVQNAQNTGMVDTIFEALANDKSFLETCNFLRSDAITNNEQNREKNARQIKNTSQSHGTTKKDKIKTVLALIHELQVQDSIDSDVTIFKICISVKIRIRISKNLDDSCFRSKEMTAK